jgi:hypothetical protein
VRIVAIAERAGSFAENKDVARSIRVEELEPALASGEEVRLDFGGVELATQSFVHALISSVIRARGADVLDHIDFRDCSETVQGVIEIVVEYSQDDTATSAGTGTEGV